MKILSLGLAGVLGGLGVIASSMTAQALDFNFSFTIKNQPITGVIQGLQDNKLNTSYSILLNSNPVGITPGTILNSVSGSFQVTNQSITSLSGIGASNNISGVKEFYMNYLHSGNYINYIIREGMSQEELYLEQNNNLYPVSHYNFTPAGTATAVPFDFNPTEGAALGIPLFIGLGMLRKKKLAKKSAQKKVAQLVS